MKKMKIGKMLIGIVTVLLTLSFLLFIANGIRDTRDARYEPQYLDEKDYLYALSSQDYVYLLDMTARDSLLGEKHSKTVRACQAVARYYEAVSLYKAYLAVGDLTAAGTQIERMEQYAVQTEEFGEYVEKKINQLFELDEAVDRAE